MGLRSKLLYVVLDGAADSISDPYTTLEKASKPGLDRLARESVCGVMYVLGRGIAPESDEAVISLLGYDPHEIYTGRGPIEAVGIGLGLREDYEIAFRANFATIDPSTRRIIDRRAGRSISRDEAVELAKTLDGLDLGIYDGYARVRASIGHRAVVIIGSRSRKLSPLVSNSDPAYERRGLISIATPSYEPYLKHVKALEDSEEARIAAELTNRFIELSIEKLDKHPINKIRRERGAPPANVILLRDAGGRIPKPEPLEKRYEARFAVLAEMPVEIGLGRIFGAKTLELEYIEDPRRNYEDKLEKTLKMLKDNDIVYIHLKGPDEPGHDGDFELKKKRIEDIDRYFITPVLEEVLEKISMIVTADHATPPSRRSHTDDPVPVLFYTPGIEPDRITIFSERNCMRGSLGVYEHGWNMLPSIIQKHLKI
ncbi:MAG: 2,3-bisphosphoglycerate-independent phosphoglycerate mutase [Sulfolobales archaeon]